ncbi:hypothetical protein AK812_SmicGene286 [Symbiodinium microadriaticum]|uniref:Uncharacterized protein n=1 Tax=Symbiodinium microadriaticum TaxID=2951 RepID=A0A1Q9F6W3_SYMMI|nr:hypothetical protein AK812_SmicGene286 [Symbiodinium microadriaticum]
MSQLYKRAQTLTIATNDTFSTPADVCMASEAAAVQLAWKFKEWEGSQAAEPEPAAATTLSVMTTLDVVTVQSLGSSTQGVDWAATAGHVGMPHMAPRFARVARSTVWRRHVATRQHLCATLRGSGGCCTPPLGAHLALAVVNLIALDLDSSVNTHV